MKQKKVDEGAGEEWRLSEMKWWSDNRTLAKAPSGSVVETVDLTDWNVKPSRYLRAVVIHMLKAHPGCCAATGYREMRAKAQWMALVKSPAERQMGLWVRKQWKLWDLISCCIYFQQRVGRICRWMECGVGEKEGDQEIFLPNVVSIY